MIIYRIKEIDNKLAIIIKSLLQVMEACNSCSIPLTDTTTGLGSRPQNQFSASYPSVWYILCKILRDTFNKLPAHKINKSGTRSIANAAAVSLLHLRN